MGDEARQTWAEAFAAEKLEIKNRRSSDKPVDDNLAGLAFSGGGIRSATFGLGVLESLKQFGILRKIDYLSTVSGGGYIGGWLSANCKRDADRPSDPPKADWLDPKADWKESIDHLRRYSNYLSPKVGFFSADTWSMATIWIRNTMLVQITVILAIAVALLVPRPLLDGFWRWPGVGNWRWTTIVLFLIGVVGIAGNQILLGGSKAPLLQAKNWLAGCVGAAVCLLAAWRFGVYMDFDPFSGGEVNYRAAVPISIALVMAGFWLQPAAVRLVGALWPGNDPPRQINYTQGWVQAMVVLPMMATGYLVAAILWGESQGQGPLAKLDSFGAFFTTAPRYWPFPLSVVFISLWLLSFCSIRSRTDWKGLLAAFAAPFVAVPVLHALLCAIMLLLHAWVKSYDGNWLAFVWTPGMVLYAFSITIVILIGMMGRQSTEGVREWWSRLGAWLSIYGFVWMVIAVSAFYGPEWVTAFVDKHPWTSLTAGAGGIGSIVAGLFAGNSGSTGGEEKTGKSNKILELVAVIAPYVFIALLLIGISVGLDSLIHANASATFAESSVALVVLAACLAGLALMAARVDINEFSLNAFYRNRLIRCYLGATRAGERQPQNFTGFDDNDDIRMSALGGNGRPWAGPLHIVNCALNLGGSSDLALHTRHSANFTLNPLYCGSSYLSREQSGKKAQLGYVPTTEYGGKDGTPTLGQAISVSGAAASPNMGYHTSPVIAFLLTMFNVRLGWWFPNPRMSGIKWPSPHFNLSYLFAELFGGASDKSKFLMISDGGHFENLAAYELIRRRCRVIIISDAECDPRLGFEGLGTLMRMCEVDFGVKITLDVASLRPAAQSKWSSNRCAVGLIDYPDAPQGFLIYLKASMTGHEDTAVLQYKASHPDFPHESTGDQFYGEDQFESYRRLGTEITWRTFEPVSNEPDLIRMAGKLLEICSPTLDNAGRFTEHSARLMDLWSRLATTTGLDDFDKELVAWPPDSATTNFRPAFYISSQMIQLMENVYLDLNLENTWGHPDNGGWRNLFTTWANSAVIKKTWSMTYETYGLRFQYFCARHLGLPGKEYAKGASVGDGDK